MAETGIQWGAANGHLKIGVNVRWTDINAGTPTSHVYADFYYQTQAWGFSDAQTLNFGGSLGGSWNYTCSSSSGATVTTLIGTYDIGNQATSYSGGPSWTFAASVSGAYNGAVPSVSYGFTLPARPASAPNAPGTPGGSSITSTSATVSWGASGTNGTGVTSYRLQVSTSSGFGSLVYDNTVAGTSASVTGLTRHTTYYVRAYANSGAGNSGWSGTGSFTTASTVPDQMSAPSVDTILQDSVRVVFSAPNNGGSAITAYALQISSSSTFASDVHSYSPSSSPYTATGLTPGTTYYARMRATNAVGTQSTWSTSATFQTISGAWVKVSGSWVRAKVWVHAGGAWKLAKVWKRAGGTWRL